MSGGTAAKMRVRTEFMRGRQQQLCKSRGDWYLTDVNPQHQYKLLIVANALNFAEHMVLSQTNQRYRENSLSSKT